MSFVKFPSLESFSHVWRNQSRLMDGPVMKFGAKIKLHGTNAAIRCEGGEVFAQKRTSDVGIHDDNAGFANWLEPRKAKWALKSTLLDPVVYFGEWAGPGVQKGDAVAQLDQKYFFIFAVQIGDRMILEPSVIEEMLPEPDDDDTLDNVLVLPWFGGPITIDFSAPHKTDEIVQYLNKVVEEIGNCDPFIKDTFEVEGPGEGLVVMPMHPRNGDIERDIYSSFTFKVKAEHHGVKKVKNPASRKFDIPSGAQEFVHMFVTEARCQQGLSEVCGGVAEKPRTPDFLKWMGNDVRKESVVELEEAGLEWGSVAKLINQAAVVWFMKKCDNPFAAAA